MILNKKPLMLAEVKEYVADLEENKVMNDYLKSYTKLSKDKAITLAEEIKGLNNPKIKEEHIVKIVDLLPQDSEDLNKIFVEAVLTEEESNAILTIVKKY
jgi:DNA-directed RNA polymerase subunit F